MTTNTSARNRICFNFLTIRALAFGTVNSWTGFSENLCKKKHVQSHFQVKPSLANDICKAIPSLPTDLVRHNRSAGTAFAHTYIAQVSASSPLGTAGTAEVPWACNWEENSNFSLPQNKAGSAVTSLLQ